MKGLQGDPEPASIAPSSISGLSMSAEIASHFIDPLVYTLDKKVKTMKNLNTP